MLELFNAFGIRAPQMITTDLKARATAADRVRTRILEVCEREGPDFVVGVLRRMLQVAEDGARKRIASWLDGKYRCVNFADALGTEHGLVRNASLTLVKAGDEITLDFTGTSPENLSPVSRARPGGGRPRGQLRLLVRVLRPADLVGHVRAVHVRDPEGHGAEPRRPGGDVVLA